MSKRKSKKSTKSTGISTQTDDERLVEQWKIKNLIKSLRKARGNGTSMISLILSPKEQIARAQKMLSDEIGTASNIKSRVNRLSVLSAITSVKERLKRYSRVPPNGLVIYCGQVLTDEGKEKKLSMNFEPFKPINTTLYLCDNKFHVEALEELLESDSTFGFVIMDGTGCLFGTLCGNVCHVLQKFSVELPKKHGRGGQSAARFGRLRMEKRQNYVRKCAEACTQHFLPNNSDKPVVEGLVFGGCASFKLQLRDSDILDPRLRAIILKIVDTSYGGENGFNQAIELSKEALANVKFVREKQILAQYMEEIAKDTGKYCFGMKDTMRALEMSAVETIIVWDNLDVMRFELTHPVSSETKTEFLTKDQLDADEENDWLKDRQTGVTWDVTKTEDFLEWLANHYKEFGAKLEFVTDRSQEGAQFVKGFGGVGGLLRYQVDFVAIDEYMDIGEDDDDNWI